MKMLLAAVIHLLFFAIAVPAQSPVSVNRDAAAVKFVTSDIDNFWRAFDMAAKESDKAKKAAIYQSEYLDKGSDGLKDFIRLRIKTAESLADIIEKNLKFYASARPSTLQVTNMQKRMRKSFRKFKKTYPDAVFPNFTARRPPRRPRNFRFGSRSYYHRSMYFRRSSLTNRATTISLFRGR
jgi:hypothetical protein